MTTWYEQTSRRRLAGAAMAVIYVVASILFKPAALLYGLFF